MTQRNTNTTIKIRRGLKIVLLILTISFFGIQQDGYAQQAGRQVKVDSSKLPRLLQSAAADSLMKKYGVPYSTAYLDSLRHQLMQRYFKGRIDNKIDISGERIKIEVVPQKNDNQRKQLLKRRAERKARMTERFRQHRLEVKRNIITSYLPHPVRGKISPQIGVKAADREQINRREAGQDQIEKRQREHLKEIRQRIEKQQSRLVETEPQQNNGITLAEIKKRFQQRKSKLAGKRAGAEKQMQAANNREEDKREKRLEVETELKQRVEQRNEQLNAKQQKEWDNLSIAEIKKRFKELQSQQAGVIAESESRKQAVTSTKREARQQRLEDLRLKRQRKLHQRVEKQRSGLIETEPQQNEGLTIAEIKARFLHRKSKQAGKRAHPENQIQTVKNREEERQGRLEVEEGIKPSIQQHRAPPGEKQQTQWENLTIAEIKKRYSRRQSERSGEITEPENQIQAVINKGKEARQERLQYKKEKRQRHEERKRQQYSERQEEWDNLTIEEIKERFNQGKRNKAGVSTETGNRKQAIASRRRQERFEALQLQRQQQTVQNPIIAMATVQEDTVPVTAQDSLALVALYNATNGASWTNNTNWLTGPVRDWFGVVVDSNHVASLSLSENGLSGTIPPELGDLTGLETLNLSFNGLTGAIPREIGNLLQLKTLILTANELTGAIPKELTNLSNLIEADLSFNEFTSAEFAELVNLGQLEVLNLSNNSLGPIVPENINDLVNLEELRLNSNNIEVFPAITSLDTLRLLHIDDNRLTFEDIEPNIGEPNSSFIYAPQDSIGTSQTYSVFKGDSLSFSFNVGGQNNVYQWYLNGVPIDGATSDTYTIPSAGTEDEGTYLLVIENTVAAALTLTSRPVFVNLKPPPVAVQDSLALVALYNATDGANWHNKENWLAGPVRNWFGLSVDSTGRVTELDLRDNNLAGSIPDSLGLLTELRKLELQNNQITGSIPDIIGNLNDLILLNLFGNELTGSIPNTIGNLVQLQNLTLTLNNLTGNIPPQIGNLESLKTLALDFNNLTGSIPDSIGNLSQLRTLILNRNSLTGAIPPTIGNLAELQQLRLQNNKLTGAVPVEINNLSNLFDLRLDSNNLAELPAVTLNGFNSFNILGNRFTFEDIEPNINKLTNYAPQDSIGTSQTYSVFKGDSLSFSFSVGGQSNLYQWYHNGVAIDSATSDTYHIASAGPEDEGTYLLEITNTVATGLTLTSRPVFVNLKLPPVVVQDSLALVALYNATNGDNWTNNTNWLTGPVRDWFGVTVVSGRVIKVDLSRSTNDEGSLLASGNNLAGTIPSEIGNLDSLQVLILGSFFDKSNSLTGEIPPEIGNLSQLKKLVLTKNTLTGSIPVEIGNLVNLSELYLDHNDLTGNIPSTLSNLNNLQHLDLGFNKLTGSIPASIGNLTQLQSLSLAVNNLNGSIPAELGSLSNLEGLYLQANDLSGSIPPQIGNLTNLQILRLAGNMLTGEIPVEMGNLTNLEFLYLQGNELTGNIPTSIGNLSQLQKLFLGGNQLTGAVPAQIDSLLNLNFLALADNNLTGLPSLDSLSNSLLTLKIERNKFTFEDIEPNIGVAVEVFSYSPQDSVGISQTYSVVEGNGLLLSFEVGGQNNVYQWYRNGVPIEGANSDEYQVVFADQTHEGTYLLKITNTVAAELTLTSRPIFVNVKSPPVAEQDSLALVALYNSTNGDNWARNDNWLTGPVREWYGVTVDSNRVSNLILIENKLTGTIPAEIGNITELDTLDLSKNALSGAIPPEMGNLANLRVLYLTMNDLTGSIPVELAQLTNLRDLRLSNNPLTGEIPPELGNLNQLQTLFLSNNNLTGTIPDKLGNLTKLTFLSLSGTKVTGPIPASLGNLSNLRVLNMRFNDNLSGPIPPEIGNLVNLRNLNLGGNDLTGSIPSTIGNLDKLDSIFLGFNNLSGAVPPAINDMQSLEYVVIRENNLTDLPALTSLENLTNLFINGNVFTFEDIEPNIGLPSDTLVYAPQDSVGASQTYSVFEGDSLTFSFTVGGQNNVYQWYRNGVALTGDTSDTFTITSAGPEDEGTYILKIDNTVAADLTLTSRPVFVNVKPPPMAEQDSLALVALYNATDGANWTNNTGWLAAPVKDWFGVTVDSGRVTQLDLDDNNLSGALPAELGNLANLETLSLSVNELTGTIPGELGNLTNLNELLLDNNNLSSTIPSQLGQLTNLEILDLTANQLTGAVPAQFNNLQNLISLSLRFNDLVEIPALTSLDSLLIFIIDDNRFTFEDIEPNIGVSSNTFDYAPQDSVGTSQTYSVLEGDSLSFSFSVGGQSNVYQWYHNGAVVPGDTTETFTISSVGPADEGTYILKIDNTVATDLTLVSRPVFVNLSTAVVEQDSLALVALYNATDGDNWANNTGWLTAPVSEWHGVTVDSNRVTKLVLSSNSLTGSLPPEIGNLINLRELILSYNDLSGSIPPEIGNLSNLKALHLHENNLSGSIPPELGNLSELEDLTVYRNGLTGSIPPELGNLSNLEVLWIGNNELTGSIPSELGNLDSLRYLELSLNKLTGSIPPELGKLQNLRVLWIFDNQLSGSIPPELGSLTKLFRLALSKNDLSGNIPPELGNLPNLQYLFLYGNNLRGSIPPELSQAESLRYLRLSSNNLTGSVPQSFNDLQNLNYLNVSNNKMSELPALGKLDSTLNELYVAKNLFTFEDIKPNIGIPNEIFDYAPQDSAGAAKSFTLAQGDSISFSFNIGGVNNVYRWYLYQDGVRFLVDTTDTYTIASADFTDEGKYILETTNTAVDSLTIYSRPVFVNVNRASVATQDSLALVALYNSTNGDNWTNNEGWLTAPVREWFGVTVDSGRVTGLNLAGEGFVFVDSTGTFTIKTNNLTGTLPLELGDLTNIEFLDLSFNEITGSIPVELANLDSLRALHLAFNDLSGTIPPELGNLTSLQYLSLRSNKLTGEIPPELGNLSNLEVLILWNNQLIGTIPPELGQLSNLIYLDLDVNQLTGPIPPELGNLNNLEILALNVNQLTGPIPPELGNLSNIEQLQLGGNQLTGSIPAELGNLPNLVFLYLPNNRLTGSIPSELGNLSNLVSLWISNNEFTGPIPSELGNIDSLRFLYLYNNELSGSIPPELGQLQNLADFYIYGNKLTGVVPNSLTNLNKLRRFFLSDNNLSELPNLSPIDSLKFLRIYGNQFTFEDIAPNIGIVPDSNFVYTPQDSVGETQTYNIPAGSSLTFSFSVGGANNVYRWYLYQDGIKFLVDTTDTYTIASADFTDEGKYVLETTNPAVDSLTIFSRPVFVNVGRAPIAAQDSLALVALYNSTNGENWTNNTGWLTAPVREWFGVAVDSGRVVALDLSASVISGSEESNNLTGALPPELGNLTKIVYLDLSNNQIAGTIPPELGNLESLESLNLDGNPLTGSIPSELGNLTNLIHLSIEKTQLTGSIPPELGQLTNLVSLDLDDNQLTGAIPPELGNLTNLIHLSIERTQIGGSIPSELGQLSNLEFLGLFNNQLTGAIPPELGQLSNLIVLNLDRNELTGSIPPEIGNLSQLEYLNLSRNPLTGEIPPELGDLINLKQLFISATEISGSIPAELGNLESLVLLRLSANNLTGPIPQELGNLSQLRILNLLSNELSGSIPPELGQLDNLFTLGLSFNNLTGSIPPELGNLSNLSGFLAIGGNELAGHIPPQLSKLDKLRFLNLFDNNLTGSIPTELAGMENLHQIWISNNELSGNIPSELGTMEFLRTISLIQNNLSGDIPAELGNLSNLTIFYLANNNLTGAIPTGLEDVSFIRLGKNQLTGAVPEAWGSSDTLRIVGLGDNLLTSIPDFSDADSLSILLVDSLKLTFKSIIPNTGLELDSLSFKPQKPFGEPQTVAAAIGTSITLTPQTELPQNQYQWFKDSTAISGETERLLTISDVKESDYASYYVKVTNPNVPDLAITSLPFTIAEVNRTFNVSYNTGWKLVSKPFSGAKNVAAIFSAADTSTLYSYNGKYVAASSLSQGTGYWLKFTGKDSVSFAGNLSASLELELRKGWNLIGSATDTAQFANIDDPDDILIEGTLFSYNGAYQSQNKLLPGRGYWIRTDTAGTIVLNVQTPQAQKSANQTPLTAGFDRLHFSNGRLEQNLYINGEMRDELSRINFSLPPAAPKPSLDVRFKGNYRLAEADSAVITIQSSSYPVTITLTPDLSRTVYAITAIEDGKKQATYTLTPEKPVRLESDFDKIVVKRTTAEQQQIPDSFNLYQNYPNPFRAVTTIKYDLPEQSDVSITVYDILGRRVKVLVNANKAAGSYKLALDASSLASGIYIIHMQAGSYVETKKITLIK